MGYEYDRTLQGAQNNNFNNNPFIAPGTTVNNPGFGFTGNLSTSREYATFTTGENLGRWNDTVSLNYSQYGGSAAYGGASQGNYTNTLKYAATRAITLIGVVGYQSVQYPSQSYALNDPTWQLGATVVPNADSSITVLYGRTYGETTWEVDGTYSPGPRTQLAIRYQTGVDTGLAAQQRLLQTTTVGPGGILLDRITGLPVLQSNLNASQYGLSRTRTFSFTAAYVINRDAFTASISNFEQSSLVPTTSIVGVTTPAGTSTTTTSGTLNWSHDLNPTTTFSNAFSYSVSSIGVYLGNPGSSQNVATFQSTLSHNFSETLSGNVQYSYINRGGAALNGLPSNFGGATTQSLITAGLRKSF